MSDLEQRVAELERRLDELAALVSRPAAPSLEEQHRAKEAARKAKEE